MCSDAASTPFHLLSILLLLQNAKKCIKNLNLMIRRTEKMSSYIFVFCTLCPVVKKFLYTEYHLGHKTVGCIALLTNVLYKKNLANITKRYDRVYLIKNDTVCVVFFLTLAQSCGGFCASHCTKITQR
jgi:hypothetical protein